jgi:hypothetical protein
MEPVVVTITGDSSGLDRAVNDASSALAGLDRGYQGVTAGSASFGRASDATKTKLEGLKKVAQGLGLGSVAGDVEDLAQGFGALGPVAAAAGAALLTVGGASVALYKVVSAITDASLSLESLNEEVRGVKELQGVWTDDDIQRSNDAATALDAIGEIAKVVAGNLGTFYLPIVEQVSVGLLEFALLVKDVNEANYQLAIRVKDVVAEYLPLADVLEYVNGLTGDYQQRARDTIQAMQDQEQTASTFAAMMQAAAESRESYAKSQAEAERDAAAAARKASAERARQLQAEATAIEQLRGIAESSMIDRLDGMERIDAEYQRELARLAELSAASGESEEAYAALAEARYAIDEEYAAKRQELRDAEAEAVAEQQAADLEAYHEKLDEQWSAYEAADKARRAAAKEEAQEEDERRKSQADYIAQTYQTLGGMVADYYASKADSAKDGSRAESEAALTAFRVEQGLALARIPIDTAMAITKAFALFGPPPSPPGIAAAAIATATGIAQTAAVLAQKPPTAHDGRSADEVNALLLRDEAVLNSRAARALGDQAISALNRTGSVPSGGPSYAIFAPDGREVDSLASRLRQTRAMRMARSPRSEVYR